MGGRSQSYCSRTKKSSGINESFNNAMSDEHGVNNSQEAKKIEVVELHDEHVDEFENHQKRTWTLSNYFAFVIVKFSGLIDRIINFLK